jgi:hypothetical protein
MGVKREGWGDICISSFYHTRSMEHAQDDHDDDDDAAMCVVLWIVEASMGWTGRTPLLGLLPSSRTGLMPSRIKRQE